jgi:tight adherence protein C
MIWLAVLIVVSLIGPDYWLRIHIAKRQRLIIKALPDVTDLLSLCVNAGLDFSVAVKWVVEKSKTNPLIEELGLFLFETKIGKSRKQAIAIAMSEAKMPKKKGMK